MSESLEIEMAHAWERLRPFTRRADSDVAVEERVRAWAACVGRLAVVFAAHYGLAEVTARFAVPIDYAAFMAGVGGGWEWNPEHRPQTLLPAAAVTDETVAEFRRFVTERPTEEWFTRDFNEPPDDGLWLSIGSIPGCKHATLLCCDRRHGDYGCVIDHFDGHPWLNGAGSYDVVGRSFAEWLTGQAADAVPQTS